jgi:hypothetical protein
MKTISIADLSDGNYFFVVDYANTTIMKKIITK